MQGKHVGRFGWYDLVTNDASAAVAFYREVVGWQKQSWEGGEYTLFTGAQGPLGGVIQRAGRPPHWTSYVLVDDVDAAAGKAKELGGRLYVQPSEIAGVGRYAVIADPQGASIALFTPVGEPLALHDITRQGEFDWNELLTTDQDKAFAFYSQLFGWQKLQEQEVPEVGTYLIYGIGDKQLGGICTKTAGMMALPAAWIYYINIGDLDEATRRAIALGARLTRGPVDAPDGSHVAHLVDPQGAEFALHEPLRRPAAAGG
jgi:predicted enzyme related to lactoylglutathione lyase